MEQCEICHGVGQLACDHHPADNVFGWDYDYEDCPDCHGIGVKVSVVNIPVWSYPYE